MSSDPTYVFAFFLDADEPSFTRELPVAQREDAIAEARQFLQNQRVLPQSATAVAVGRRVGDEVTWLGRWVWADPPEWRAA